MIRKKHLYRWLIFCVLIAMMVTMMPLSVIAADKSGEIQVDTSEQSQIVNQGGSNGNIGDDGVEVSKTISPTDSENVFDITLQVKTLQDISQIYDIPDAAVAIVMDISNTMNEKFPKGSGSSRYDAAIDAAENFITSFQQRSENSGAERKIGYVAFNTDAHEISQLTECKTKSQAQDLKSVIEQRTKSIIGQAGYESDYSRFTNIEAGLKMGADMLAKTSAENKYIIFLSDGFPTTYIKEGYKGYMPCCTSGIPGNDGVFYDMVTDKYCIYGTSYSNKAAVRARSAATAIKADGIKIFPIGIDIGGQTIKKFIEQTAGNSNFSVVDRESETYELGSAESTEVFKTWLKTGIGSNCYYDSNNAEGLKEAYESIFEEIRKEIEKKVAGKWVAEDPIPTGSDGYASFIGFFDEKDRLTGNTLQGEWKQNAENTALYTDNNKIRWDLKKSGYKSERSEDTEIYTYNVKYRIRLTNEKAGFIKENSYRTNGDTKLSYVLCINGKPGNDMTIDFPVPEVKGYLGCLCFDKIDSVSKQPVQGAKFKLKHSSEICEDKIATTCNAVAVTISDVDIASDANGKVQFENIPSGHIYKVYETKAAPGYTPLESAGIETGTVIVSYGETLFIPKDAKEPVSKFVMENTPETGNLILQKNVETDAQKGLYNPGSEKTYTFTVKGPDRAYGAYAAVRSSGENKSNEKVIFDKNHIAQIDLKDGESIKLCNVPITAEREAYSVVETNAVDTAGLVILTPEFRTGKVSVRSKQADVKVQKETDNVLLCINRFTKPQSGECNPYVIINKSITGDKKSDTSSSDSFKFAMKPLGYSLPKGGLPHESLTTKTMPSLGEFSVSSSEAGNNKKITKDSYKYTQAGVYYYKITEISAGSNYCIATPGYYVKDTVKVGKKNNDSYLYYNRELYRIDALQSANKGVENLDEAFGSGAELNTDGAQYENDGVLQFINIFTAPRSLTIQKKAGGNACSTTYDFEFEVNFDNIEPGTVIKGKYVKRNGEIELIEKKAEAAEKATGSIIKFTLKAYESMTFDNLSKDTAYEVTEKQVAGYTTEVTRNGQKTQIKKNGVKGEIKAYNGETVVFKNSRSEYVYIGCKLNIIKKVTGIDNSERSRELMKSYCAVINCNGREIVLKDFTWNGSCWQSSTYTVSGYANIDYDIRENAAPEAEGYTFKNVTVTGGDNGNGGGTAKAGETDQVTITNDYEIIRDNPPEEPEMPEKPVNPDNTGNTDNMGSKEPESTAYDANVVKTGDEAGVTAKAGIFGISALLLAVTAVIMTRRRTRKKDM